MKNVLHRARVYGRGHGEPVLGDVPAGDTLVPIADAVMFNPLGGQAIVGTLPAVAPSQIVDYTGTLLGGTGGLVGPGAAPSNAPVVGLAAGSGIETGAHSYAATYVTAAGESVASPLAAITVGTVDIPATAPQANTISAGSGPDTGSHYYGVTFVTASGETTPNTNFSGGYATTYDSTGGSISAPTSAPSTSGATSGGSCSAGYHNYAVTFTNAAGETTAGPSLSAYADPGIAPLTAPSPAPNVPFTGAISTTLFAPGDAIYVVVTYIFAYGATETTPGSQSPTYTAVTDGAGHARVAGVSGIPTGNGQGNVSSKRLYINKNGSWMGWIAVATGSATANIGDATPTAGSPPGTNTTGTPALLTIPLTSIAIGPSGTTGRKLYRTVSGGSQLKLLTTVSNNTATTYNDTTADGSLGANVPTTNTTATTTAYHRPILSSIPIGPPVVTSRKLYRTTAGGSQLKLLATIADNTTTGYTDSTVDAGLGANAPTSNTATANRVAISSIPIGPATVTARKIYRTAAAGSQLKLLTTIANNTGTTYADSTADASLGANVPTVDTSGLDQPTGQVVAGSTSLIVASIGVMPTEGWAVIGNGQQVVRYTGVTASSLTGIPATGAGSITATIGYNSTVTAAPMLTGVSGLTQDVFRGAMAHIWVQVDDIGAQAVMAALDGGDGIYEHLISDERRGEDSLRALCEADLARFGRPIVTLRYATRDPKTKAGKTVHVNLPSLGMFGDFVIQSVVIDQINISSQIGPRYTVEASSIRFSFEDVLRRLRLDPS